MAEEVSHWTGRGNQPAEVVVLVRGNDIARFVNVHGDVAVVVVGVGEAVRADLHGDTTARIYSVTETVDATCHYVVLCLNVIFNSMGSPIMCRLSISVFDTLLRTSKPTA